MTASAGGFPFSVTFAFHATRVEITFTVFFFPLTLIVLCVTIRFRAELKFRITGRCRRACASTLPAGFGVPLPGVYGVQSDVQRRSADALGSVIAEAEKVAERSFAP